jgi:hypothetical protein
MDLAKYVRRSSAVLLCVAFASASAFAQGDTGFLRGQGHFDAAISYTREHFDEFWVGNSKVSDPSVGRITRQTYALYGAYGATNDIDIEFNIPYIIATSNADQPREQDFQDLTIVAKWRALSWRDGTATWSLLPAPGIKIPMNNYEDNTPTALGDGQTDYRLHVIGHLQFDFGFYVSVETGYDIRAGLPANQIPFNATVGYTFGDLVTVSPFLSNVAQDGGTNIGQGPFPGNEEEYTRIGVSAYVRATDQIGVTGMYKWTLDGKNTGDTEGFSIGVVYRF